MDASHHFIRRTIRSTTYLQYFAYSPTQTSLFLIQPCVNSFV